MVLSCRSRPAKSSLQKVPPCCSGLPPGRVEERWWKFTAEKSIPLGALAYTESAPRC